MTVQSRLGGIPPQRRHYWMLQGSLFVLLAINVLAVNSAWLEFILGAAVLVSCVYWLVVTRVPPALSAIYVLSAVAILFFDDGLEYVLNTADSFTSLETGQSVAAILFFSLVAYGWVMTFISLFRHRKH